MQKKLCVGMATFCHMLLWQNKTVTYGYSGQISCTCSARIRTAGDKQQNFASESAL